MLRGVPKRERDRSAPTTRTCLSCAVSSARQAEETTNLAAIIRRMRDRDDPEHRSLGARVVERIRAVSAWSVLVAAVVFGFVFGLQLWVVVVAVFGFVWAGISRAV